MMIAQAVMRSLEIIAAVLLLALVVAIVLLQANVGTTPQVDRAIVWSTAIAVWMVLAVALGDGRRAVPSTIRSDP
jgi:peptidoglycan/LPS O-acetylase OafA/YrhL